MSRKQPRFRQQELVFKSWGGARKGAGRKPYARPKVPHRARPALAARHPVHVTLRLREDLHSLRHAPERLALERVFAAAKERLGLRLVQYSIQSNQCVQKG